MKKTAFSDGSVHAAKARTYTRSDHKFIETLALLTHRHCNRFSATSEFNVMQCISKYPSVSHCVLYTARKRLCTKNTNDADYPAWHVPPVFTGASTTVTRHANTMKPLSRARHLPKRPLHMLNLTWSRAADWLSVHRYFPR